MLADCRQVQLILRPDIEDRSFHETTKAYLGPEHLWPESVTTHPHGFTFSPAPCKHDPSLFGKFRIQVSGKQSIVPAA